MFSGCVTVLYTYQWRRGEVVFEVMGVQSAVARNAESLNQLARYSAPVYTFVLASFSFT